MPSGSSDLLAALSTYYEAGVYPSTIMTPGIMTSTAASITSQTTAVVTSQTSSPSTAPPPLPSTGLSAGAKAGIGVGVALSLCLVGAALYFLLRGRRKGKGVGDNGTQGMSSGAAMDCHKSELNGQSSRMEMDAVPLTYEMPNDHEVHEMPHARDDPGL